MLLEGSSPVLRATAGGSSGPGVSASRILVGTPEPLRTLALPSPEPFAGVSEQLDEHGAGHAV